jgi:hypothetical protein
MSKTRRQQKRRGAPQETAPLIPSAQTLFRTVALNRAARASVRQMLMKASPAILLRDGPNVKKMRTAPTPEALLDLTPLATGLADFAWHERMTAFGPAALPALAARLHESCRMPASDTRDGLTEKLVAALCWHGDLGAPALLRHLDEGPDYGRSLACLALGVMDRRDAADAIWRFYQRVASIREESYLMGPLWALIDLGDPRAGGALAELVRQGDEFYELYGLLARAGDARAIAPLTRRLDLLPDNARMAPTVALIAIGHRIGREALIAEWERLFADQPADMPIAALADDLLSKPAAYAESYFEMFYHH